MRLKNDPDHLSKNAKPKKRVKLNQKKGLNGHSPSLLSAIPVDGEAAKVFVEVKTVLK